MGLTCERKPVVSGRAATFRLPYHSALDRFAAAVNTMATVIGIRPRNYTTPAAL